MRMWNREWEPWFLYAIAPAAGPERGKVVKIGITTNPDQRLREVQTAFPHPLVFRAVTEGHHFVEKMIHGQLAHARMRGEWFDCTDPEVNRVVARMERNPVDYRAERESYRQWKSTWPLAVDAAREYFAFG